MFIHGGISIINEKDNSNLNSGSNTGISGSNVSSGNNIGGSSGIGVGGGNTVEKYLNDLYMYRDGYWTKIISSGKLNSLFFKFGHSFIFHNERIYILGGSNNKNIIEKSIEFINEIEIKPKPISSKSKIDLIFSKPE